MAFENLNVKFTSDTTGFSRGLKAVNSGLKQAAGGISSLIKNAAGLAGVTLTVKALADSFKAFTAFESNLKRTGDLFGSAAKNIQGFAQGSAKSFGIAESAAYQYAAVYGNLFKNITSGAMENSAVTIKMLKASAVVASKTGRTMEDVMDRIRSGLLGSTEAIEDLGINVNVAMLEMTDAFKRIADGRSWAQLTFHEQQQIRTLGILEQAHKNFGDEVQGGTAFSLSVLSSAFKDLMTTAGSFVNAVLSPIIQALTTVVQLANTALKGLSALLGFNATLSQSTADGLTAGSTAADDMAEGLGDSADEAKKLKQQLAGFDKLNDITKAEGADSKAVKPASGAGGLGIEMAFEEIEPPDTTWTDMLLAWAKEFKSLLDPLKNALSGLWETLKKIGGFAWQGLKDFYEKFLKPVGAWLLGEGLPRLVDILKNGLEAIDWQKINDAFGRLWDALAPFAIHIGEGLLWLLENVLVPIGVWAMNDLVPAAIDAITAAVKLLDEAALAIAPGIEVFVEALKPIVAWIGEKIVDAIETASETMNSWAKWFTDHKDTFLAVGEALGNVVTAIWDIIEPLADAAWKWFKDFWKDLNGVVQDFVGAALEWLVEALNNLSAWITDNKTLIEDIALVVGAFAAAWGLVNVALGVWNALGAIAAGVTSAFGAAIAFLTSPVTLVALAIGALIAIVVLLVKHWDEVKATATKVWDGIKSVWSAVAGWFTEKVIDPITESFKSAINFLISLGEGFANGFIKAINFIINALNKISFDIPDWVPIIGGGKFGFNLPTVNEISIPRLARGGIAYGEVQAVVGDNHNVRQDPEVISPLSRLQEMITAAMLQRDITGGGNGQTVTLRMVMEDGTVFAEAMIDPMNRTAKNLGYSPVFKVEMA